MDRRGFLTAYKNRIEDRRTAEQPVLEAIPAELFAAPPPETGLKAYQGAWTEDEAIHLLKRAMFGATRADVKYFAGLTMSQAVDELLNPSAALPAPPVKEYSSASALTQPDTNIAAGTTWVNDVNADGTIQGNRRASLKKWWMGVMVRQDRSIREKMTLFLHNHFATQTNTIGNGNYCYQYCNLLRTNAVGNFKTLTRAVTLDPGMLVFLNGQSNKASAPDENYGRELQELFTCGKGPGSQYTEADVKAAARVLTGWRIDATKMTSYFTSTLHDSTNKQFSAFYNNTIIAGKTGATAGDQELDALMNMIFATQEVAKFICRKLYRWFVYYDIDATVEANIIAPLADIFRTNNYEFKPVLSALLKSEHFFDSLSRGCVIKSPVDLMVSSLREFGVVLPDPSDYVSNYAMYNYLVSVASNMQQNLGDPPDVSGWKPYYQIPQFYEIWINSDTLPKRNQFTDTMVVNGYTANGKKMLIDGTVFAATLSNPSDPNALITDSVKLLYRIDLSDTIKAQLKKDILLGGQVNDAYWTSAWNAFQSNPSDMANTTTVKNRLRDLYKYLMDLSEYQLT